MIEVKNVYFSYPNSDTQTLFNINLLINKGELVVLTGPSGSGKSTLAKIVAGHIAPSTGKVTFEGRDYSGIPGRHSILIHQESDLFPWFTVSEQIELALQLNTSKDKNIDFYLELAKLDHVRHFYPHQLSGGMKKRASVVRALAAKPKLLILDESFSSLDADLHLELSLELKKLWQQTQTTTLILTHDSRDINLFGQNHFELSDLSKYEK